MIIIAQSRVDVNVKMDVIKISGGVILLNHFSQMLMTIIHVSLKMLMEYPVFLIQFPALKVSYPGEHRNVNCL